MLVTKFSRLKRALLIVGALLTLSVFGVACSSEEEIKPTIRFSDTQFESLWINNAIAQYVIKHGYGYPVLK
jgi:ABC-type proline/glycine betaine transport system substrate-binding protein